MKKTLNIIIIFCFALLLGVTAQERTVTLNNGNPFDVGVSTFAYNGSSADRLIPTTRDTIDYILLLTGMDSDPLNVYAQVTLDSIDGADTTVAITVQIKRFNSEAYVDLIASALTSAVTAEVKTVKTTLGVTTQYTETVASATDYLRQAVAGNSDTLTVAARTVTSITNPLLFYRYIKFRLIIQGNDQVGTGIQVKRIELAFLN